MQRDVFVLQFCQWFTKEYFWLMSENIHLWPIHSFDHSIKVFPGVYSTEVQRQAELPDTTPVSSGLSWSWLSLCPWKPVGGQVEEISLQRDSVTQDRVHLMTIYKGMAIWLPFSALWYWRSGKSLAFTQKMPYYASAICVLMLLLAKKIQAELWATLRLEVNDWSLE